MSSSNSRLTVLVLYGWESNPYAECAIRALLQKGVRVLLVTRATSQWKIEGENFKLYPLFPGHRKGRSPLRIIAREIVALGKVLRLALREQPTLVHYQSFRMIRLDWILIPLLKILGKKIVFTIHDTSSLEDSAVDSFIFRQSAGRAGRLLVHTAHSRNIVERDWRVPASRIRVIPHGGYDDYYNLSGSKAEARRALGFGEDDFVCLTFGTIRPYKGIDYLLPAIAQVRSWMPVFKAIIAGRAHDRMLSDRYRRMIDSLQVSDLVDFRERFIESRELENLFRACDLVVLPYVKIDQSGVLFLAYTFGRPVLATSVGGLPELIDVGKTGFVIPPSDTNRLAEALIAAAFDRARLETMGQCARAKMEREFTWDRQADITIDTYRELAQQDRQDDARCA